MTEGLKVIVWKWDPGGIRPWGWHCEICSRVNFHNTWRRAYDVGQDHIFIWHGGSADGQQA